MFYKNILSIIFFLILTNCTTETLVKNKPNGFMINGYSNKGFALVYSEDILEKKIVSKKIDPRTLIIFQKHLKINTKVKITNILNNKSLVGTVGKNSEYPLFYNAVLSKRIAEELNLDINQPYVEILEILENSIFIAQKAKTYDEEKNVAVKAPVKKISINDLNSVKKSNKKSLNTKFSYIVKIGDFYFNDTALMMSNRIKTVSLIKNPKIKKISDKKYRVYLGPFSDINSLQKSYNDISILEFDNIEIIKYD
tara:strand:- start:544 stop:1302 length:759 start_codon:yes stop_codon:yes gene_type:complete